MPRPERSAAAAPGARRRAQNRNADPDSLRSQIRRHSVALISLALAAASLAYNTWRNETSELHRNWRQAAFEIMSEVSELEEIVLYRRYFHGRQEHPLTPLQDATTWVAGWGKVAAIRDLSSILPEPMPDTGRQLHATWQRHAADLDASGEEAQEAEQALMDAIRQTRGVIVELIHQLR